VDVHSPATIIYVLLFNKIPLPVPIPASNTQHISGSGFVTFGYTVSSRTAAEIRYQRYLSPGSGFLPGANSNAVRGTVSHLFKVRWTGVLDTGYSRNTALRNATQTTGINASGYQYWYFGGSMRRQLSEHFDAFASYQFNEFSAQSCTTTAVNTSVCGQTSGRHTGVIGIDWRPRPIRLD
jgi:hypothetical protein